MKLKCDPFVSRAQLEMERDLTLREWHPFFAIQPRRVGPTECRWLEWIERKGTYWQRGESGPWWEWEYRAK